MQHQQVIENFINKGIEGIGTYVKADNGMLVSKIPALYNEHGWRRRESRETPLAARLEGDSLLVNGARLNWPDASHQRSVLTTLQHSSSRFGVILFHPIVAAWTDSETRDWNQAPIPPRKLRKEVGNVAPARVIGGGKSS